MRKTSKHVGRAAPRNHGTFPQIRPNNLLLHISHIHFLEKLERLRTNKIGPAGKGR